MSQHQMRLFALDTARKPRTYGDAITASVNLKGCLDVDTVKGCSMGMLSQPGGCYGECYANKIAKRYGIRFDQAVRREFVDQWQHRDVLVRQMREHDLTWYRVGVMGDPSHAWGHTVGVIKHLWPAEKTAVIVTKHWVTLTDDQISKLIDLDVVVQTSTSALDTEAHTNHRVEQFERLREAGIRSVNRVVTCRFGESKWAKDRQRTQDWLVSFEPIIDTPLRVSPNNPLVQSGEIIVEKRADSVGGGKLVSVNNPNVYLGNCAGCPDNCGVHQDPVKRGVIVTQVEIFPELKSDVRPIENGDIEFKYVKTVIGSGYEEQVGALGIEDGIAYRAARKNMQIHSAIILLCDGEFAGFFTFQDNREVGEFCLLQSVIKPEVHTPELYLEMARQVTRHNDANLPMLMTVNPKSKFETPEVFEGLGFKTYLKRSGFEYMLAGDDSYHRLKTLAHISMTNVWDSPKGDWLRLKKEWNQKLDGVGEELGIPNPRLATREGCWQGEAGFSNVVTGRSHNANASVLDPVACEVILRIFTPTECGRIYNPFGGGVQFGFVAGASGYKYLASEIRQNQCDANNKLCSQFDGVEWVQADSSTYKPDFKSDLVFACPPYYRVERYLDYEDVIPEGEINAMGSYEEFREALFQGYTLAIESLNDNRFIAIMTGDSRNPKGAYHCHEAETEIFFKELGLMVYNKIVYLESAFTRLAQAKKTLNYRKFPKREQRIIIAYKGDPSVITDEFPEIGRL